MAKCANGHFYDPAIYGDKCPFCPGEFFVGYVEQMMSPVYISAENWNSASKLIYSVDGRNGYHMIEVTADIIVIKICVRGKGETESSYKNFKEKLVVYSFSNESVSFNALKQWLSEQNIYNQWQDGDRIIRGASGGASEHLEIIKQDKCVFGAQRNLSNGRGNLHCECDLSRVFMKLLPDYVIQEIKTIY